MVVKIYIALNLQQPQNNNRVVYECGLQLLALACLHGIVKLIRAPYIKRNLKAALFDSQTFFCVYYFKTLFSLLVFFPSGFGWTCYC